MPETLTAGVLLAGRFELQSTLGRGGMATVYRAWDHVGQRPCAVKILSELLSGDEQFRLRFRQEATAAQGLTHPNIVRVGEWGEAGSHHYIVMEYVTGGTLRDLLGRRGPLPQALALRIAVEVADALAHAHARGVIHRDIKPENLLLAEDGRIKVADFGIARTVDAAALTRTGIVMGSARYLSPEQARGQSTGARSDLYALGVVLFEMLAGRVPFDGESAVAIAVQHVHERPPRLQQLRPDVPEAIAACVERLLAKDEEDRYRTAGALAGELRRLAALFPSGFEDTTVLATAPTLGPMAVMEPTPLDLRIRQFPQEVSCTVPLPASTQGITSGGVAAGGTGAATAALPATGGDTRIPPRVATPATRHGPTDLRPAAYVAVLLALAVVLGANGHRFRQPRVTVPSLSGQSVMAASETVRTMGLRVVVVDRRQDVRIPVGMIIAQDPPSGGDVGKDSVVRVVVSQGSGIVPDLRGLPLDDAARRQVQAAGLRLRRIGGIGGRGSDEEGSGGTIVFQLQAPGTHLAPDATVDVVLAPRVVQKTPDPVVPVREKYGGDKD